MNSNLQNRLLKQYETAVHCEKPREIIKSFKNIMNSDLIFAYESEELISMVLNACIYTNQLEFAQTVWKYINQHKIMKPTTNKLYSKMISIHQRLIINISQNDNDHRRSMKMMLKIHEIFLKWSLNDNLGADGRDIAIINQLLGSLRYLHKHCIHQRRRFLFQYLFFMLESNIMPTNSTRSLLLEFTDCIINGHYNLHSYAGKQMFIEWLNCKDGQQLLAKLESEHVFYYELLGSVIFRSFEYDESEWTNSSIMWLKHGINTEQNSIFYINLLIVYFHKIRFASAADVKLIMPYINKVFHQWCKEMILNHEILKISIDREFDVIILNQMLTLLHYAKLDLKDKQEMLYVYLNIAISMNIKPNDGTSYWLAKLAGFNGFDCQSVIKRSNATELLHATKNVLSLFVKSNNQSWQF